jgi:hypothetical protein
MGSLRSPEGSGIKGGIVNYHVVRMLVGLALMREFPLDADFIERMTVYHAKLAARAALNQIYNGRRPK